MPGNTYGPGACTGWMAPIAGGHQPGVSGVDATSGRVVQCMMTRHDAGIGVRHLRGGTLTDFVVRG